MSKKKPGVPSTKVEPPKTIKLTKTQRELFITKRNAHNEGLKVTIDEYNKLSSEILGKLVDDFIVELNIDVIGENWSFDANTMQFEKQEKK